MSNSPLSPSSLAAQILDLVDDLFFVLDRQWRFTYLNRRVVQEAGAAEGLLGRTVWEAYPQLLGTEVEGQYRRAMAGQAGRFETPGALSGRWYEVHAYPCPEGLVVHARDVTDRRQAEAALQESEERFRQFMDNGPAVAWIKDEAGRHVYINRRFEELHGIGPAAALGRDASAFFPPEVARQFHASDRAVLEADRPLEFAEVAPGPGGAPRHVHVYKFPFRDAAGCRYVGGMAVDVTEQRQAQAKLQEYARRLLEVQEQERRHLARELHDEVGQLLTGLRLTLGAGAGQSGETAGTLEQAQAILRELTGRVRDLSLRLRPSMLDDLGLLPALLWLLQRYAAQTGVVVDFEHTGLGGRFAPEVETAAYRIVQEALTNVARHAGVGRCGVRLRRERDALRLEVQDAGRGFDTPARGATGGLSGMEERAALLGGTLRVESGAGAGTRVTAELPLAAAGGATGSPHDGQGSHGRR